MFFITLTREFEGPDPSVSYKIDNTIRSAAIAAIKTKMKRKLGAGPVTPSGSPSGSIISQSSYIKKTLHHFSKRGWVKLIAKNVFHLVSIYVLGFHPVPFIPF